MKVSVLIPTYNRRHALTATLTALCAQTFKDFEVVVADQSDTFVGDDKTIQTIKRLLEFHQNPVKILPNFPKRGIAQQRQFLLENSSGTYSLFLDDDVVLEPDVIERMVKAIEEERTGFAGMALIGLSYLEDRRPHQQNIEFWEDAVEPEIVRPGTEKWQRYPLHNAANIHHVAVNLGITPENQRKYKVAWVGGCILYDTAKLKETGGFDFWEQLPVDHCGEDVLAQVKLMERYGGFGIIPSGAYHLELPTTIENREVNAPEFLLG
ncbi:glycosyltransferase family 2 protein [Pedobacter sp. SYSU D00535]|uniref:glycosyltransferase family 2 protein n=1 Tax=Pedobacter sp. SYSU D00535 TaxID=2810308 RepID=UPI001A975D23|nr:glycosyltransferase family 2 protein [Pedobacter sp. SYSU D00535]